MGSSFDRPILELLDTSSITKEAKYYYYMCFFRSTSTCHHFLGMDWIYVDIEDEDDFEYYDGHNPYFDAFNFDIEINEL